MLRHYPKKKQKENYPAFFAVFFSIKLVSKAETCISLRAIPTSKTKEKFIFHLRPHSLKQILSHFVILSKHVLPDLSLTLTASRYFTECNAAISITYLE